MLNKIRKLTNDINEVYKIIKLENYGEESKEFSEFRDSIGRLKGLTNKMHKQKLLTEIPKKSFNHKNYCYVCKIKISNSTHNMHYTNMCDFCVSIETSTRTQTKDLTGKIAIITGGRVKIGFETALRLLKNNCTVIVTSRFVDDCLRRYKNDEDFETFKDRLVIYQLELLNNKKIQLFIEYITSTYNKIDYLINNAAQTIRRPKQFYKHLIDLAYENNKNMKTLECCLARDLSDFNSPTIQYEKLKELTMDPVNKDNIEDVSILTTTEVKKEISTGLVDSESSKYFPKDTFDIYEQQIDLREINSWILKLDEINVNELSETCIINSIVPFILCSKFNLLLIVL